MSSTDPTTIAVHRALHEALNSAREARHHLEDGDATPDRDDLVALGRCWRRCPRVSWPSTPK